MGALSFATPFPLLWLFLIKTGEYLVDPNGGSTKDRIRVLCNFTNQATCIRPKVKKVC